MVDLTWGRLVVAVLAIIVVGALACWRFYRIGFEAAVEDVAESEFLRGYRVANENRRVDEERAEAARLAAIREHRSEGAKKAWRTRKGEA